MTADFRDTFLLALERGLLPAPQAAEKWLVYNAHALPQDALAPATACFEQGFRPAFNDLRAAGADVVPEFDAKASCDHAVVFAGRVRLVNEANFTRAWQAVRPGGTVVVAGDKACGIASLRTFVSSRVELSDSFSKHHAVCFWCMRSDRDLALDVAVDAKPQFSAGKVDKGSAMLAAHLDQRIAGRVADFGAGDGYLTHSLILASDRVTSVDLMEAEWAALEMAKARAFESRVSLSFHWIDITRELKKKPYDWVIMNPPFHHGLHGSTGPDLELGRRFIAQAASTLVPGGRLLLVANRKLAYERTLETCFRRTAMLEERDGYKVIEATR